MYIAKNNIAYNFLTIFCVEFPEDELSDAETLRTVTMRINPTSAYEVMWIYCNISVVNILHVSATFCGHLQGCVVRRIYYNDFKTNEKTKYFIFLFININIKYFIFIIHKY